MSTKLMDVKRRLLKLRLKMNRTRVEFRRLNILGLRRVDEERWRRPRGIDNKIKLSRKGYPPIVRIGYRNPKLVRGLHPSGLIEILVYRPQDLDNLDPKIHCVRIAHTVGRRKRLQIIDKAKSMGFRILNAVGVEE
ncbi:MAG: 50S ribosomal protein L32e [Candidatus Nezhaarchaeales archaeon]|nr:MAG: 50S ribosomal protein L32e [Candidatus Nezhaarchaeota archaeon WYZ-LMO8]TDA34293.1 MAG: 50S ribosomal protein L32e [Candidatus Nezhaarchaeota archaeon WYZ-LMO7]